MDPSLRPVWDSFSEERNRDLYERLPGWYRAVVVETNDPLRIGRVRFKMPEIHNVDLKPEVCPWAVPAFPFGGQRAGQWYSPCIGDIVWISFEKQHLYGPIWTGSADPTRRKFYPLPSLSGGTPQAVNVKGEPADSPNDYDSDYHPKDNRPMSFGCQDRYGNVDIFSAVGFFPAEHKKKPAEAGVDSVTMEVFKNASTKPPEPNEPDVKYAARITKYGTYALHSDVGYKWNEEFKGDFDEDEEFEIKRWKYFLKLLNEGKPKDHDQRRYEVRTRYGMKLEAREVGWQKTRSEEYESEQKTIADSGGRDERWWKMRTKGGHFFQLIDTGCDAEQDLFVKRLLKTEVGTYTEEEDKLGSDQRMIRMQTRYGFKQVLDDRGSDSIDADNKEIPRGNGWFVKGRRDNRGFFVGFNEKDEANHLVVSSPTGQTLELNDRFEYVGLSTKTSTPLSELRDGHYGVEWVTNQLLGLDFEANTYHLKLDKKNKYSRLKNPSGQGVEFRDKGSDGGCSPWAEIRDEEDRGVWWTTEGKYAIWRSKDSKQYIVLHDGSDYILIKNTAGKVQIIANGDVEVKSDKNVSIQAEQKVSIKAGSEICFEAAGNQAVLNGAAFGTLRNLQGATLEGTHKVIKIPMHPLAPAPPAPLGCGATTIIPEDVAEKKPKPEDKDRACAPNKSGSGPVPPSNFGGGGGPGGNTPGSPTTPPDNTPPPAPSPNEPPGPSATPPPPREPNPSDPLPNGCIWYGISDQFKTEIEEQGLLLESDSNLQNDPDASAKATKFIFASNIDLARGEDFAVLAQQRYGGFAMILKIMHVEDSELLSVVEDSNGELFEYTGEWIRPEYIEIVEIGNELLAT